MTKTTTAPEAPVVGEGVANPAPASDPKLASAYAGLLAFMPDPVIRIPSGPQPGHVATVDLRKVHPKVGLELLRQGAIKPITDISRSKEIEETWAQTHDRRLKRIANWYAGDFSVRGGGVADPVGVQMREEIVAAYKAAGVGGADLKEATKGRAEEILARVYEGDELAERLAFYRSQAEATLTARRTAADSIKIDIKKLKI